MEYKASGRIFTDAVHLRPLNDQVLIEPVLLASVSEGGITLPDTARRRSNEGTVVAIGRKVEDLKVGEQVLFLRWTGYAVTYRGRSLVCVSEGSVLCVIDERESDVSLDGAILAQRGEE
jgi:chaperonin GroES